MALLTTMPIKMIKPNMVRISLGRGVELSILRSYRPIKPPAPVRGTVSMMIGDR